MFPNLALLFLTLPVFASAMHFMTWNLRFDSKPDNITVAQSIANLPPPLNQPNFLALSGEQPWSTRRIKVVQKIIEEGVVMASFQEALVRQVNDLQQLLGDDWAHVGVGRDDGVNAGEFSPVFYRKSMFTLKSNDSFWLSNTPFEPSKFPGAGSFRIATATHFILTDSQVPFFLINTHLDDQSDAQRRLGASLLLHRAHFEALQAPSIPILITGDFNSPGTGTDSGAYRIVTGALPPVAINQTFADRFPIPSDKTDDGFVMDDTRGATSAINVGGNFATFTSFLPQNNTTEWTRIDFVLGGSNGNWRSDSYKVGTTLTDDGVIASDHRPVFNDISFT